MSLTKDCAYAYPRPLFALVALGAACLSCSTEDTNTAKRGDAGVGHDAGPASNAKPTGDEPSTTDSDASIPPTQEPVQPAPDTQQLDASGPDASRPDAADGSTLCRELDTHGCDFGLGCGNYDSKSAELPNLCDPELPNNRYYAGEGCDRLILAHNYGAGDTATAFYDPESGALVGMYTVSDTLEEECAGQVPMNCLEDTGVAGMTRDFCAGQGPDASTSTQPGTGCVDDELNFGHTGGNALWVDRLKLESCASFSIERENRRNPGANLSCGNQVAPDSPISALDVQEALEHPDVLDAFAEAPVLYGQDPRPVDGTVYRVEVGGKVIEIGNECDTAGPCTPIPAGVTTLGNLLRALDAQQRALPDCQNLQEL